MAGVNFLKCTSQKVGSMRVHMDTEERMTHGHSNTDIDRSLTHENYFVGCDDWSDMYDSWKKRVQEADEEHPPMRIRSDRVTGCFLEAVCPWEIVDNGREEEFFEALDELCRTQFGDENCMGWGIHRDEVHTYKDHGEEKTSMIHGHGLVVPYAHWKDKKGIEHEGINGKNFETKKMLTAFNKAVNDMCLERFGIEYNTHGTQRHKTVEELKQESLVQQELEMYDVRQKELSDLKLEIEQKTAEKTNIEEECTNASNELNTLNDQISSKREECNNLDKSIQDKKTQETQIEQDIEKYDDIRKSLYTKIDAASEYIQSCYGYKKPFGKSDKVTYHKDAEDHNRQFQKEFNDKVKALLDAPNNTITLEKQAQATLDAADLKEKEIQEKWNEADEARKEAERLKQHQQEEIMQAAQRLFNQTVPKNEQTRLSRLVEYISQFSTNGKSLLECFNEHEQQIIAKRRRSWMDIDIDM